MDTFDVDRISEITQALNRFSTVNVLDAISINVGGSILEGMVIQHCTVDHYGVLVFPEKISEVVSVLESNGLAVDPPVPSVVVKSRLCQRYRVYPNDIDVRILRGGFATDQFGRREIEIFAAMATHGCPLPEGMVDSERESMNESHVALRVDRPERILARLRRQLLGSGVLVADGAGYNPLEKPHEGGRSVLYFRSTEVVADRSFPHRLELTCAGEYADVIADHVRDTVDAEWAVTSLN